MPQLLFANNASTTLAVAISNSATAINVAAGTGALFPSPGAGQYFKITLYPASGSTPAPEVMDVTAVSSDTFTVVRGQEGTTASAWGVSSIVDNVITRDQLVRFGQVIPFSGNPNTYVAGQAGDSRSAPVFVWDYTNQLLYICTTSGSTSSAVWSEYYPGVNFTPVQQGGGAGQASDKVYIGWNSASNALKAQVDSYDLGYLATQGYVAIAVNNEAIIRYSSDTTLQTNINNVWSQSYSWQSPGTYTWTCPSGVYFVRASVWGGGGSGGAGTGGGQGGGGGGGGYCYGVMAVTPGNSYTVVVGSGGGSSSSNGYAGTNSSFGGTFTAGGGSGGTASSSSTVGGIGGAGGGAGGGSLILQGMTGGNGYLVPPLGGLGVGGGTFGTSATIPQTGAYANGGTFPGGGGSGGVTVASGGGAPGFVKIEF